MRIRPAFWLMTLGGLFVTGAATAAALSAGADPEATVRLYANVCSGCHGASLQGASASALLGPAFRISWPHALGLFEFVAANMPLGAGGSLRAQQYWDLVAHILRRNDVRVPEPFTPERAAQTTLRRS